MKKKKEVIFFSHLHLKEQNHYLFSSYDILIDYE